MTLDALTPSERFVVEWQYGMLGGFRTALAQAIAKADTNNRALLARGFPDEVEGYTQFAEVSGWWDAVEKRAGLT